MLKCMVCGEPLYIVNNTHLKKHGLTIQQYKERFNGLIYSAEYWRRYWAGRRTYNRLCRMCGSAFTTKSDNPNVVRCRRCQAKVSLEKQRRFKRMWWLKRKFTLRREKAGTFGERYLEIVEGRVLGAVLLERSISLNRSSMHNGGGLQCENCGSDWIIDIVDHEPYCAECGNKIMLARENEHYTMPIEPVCDSCGLVYSFSNP